jgi:hypothetical protein
MNPTKLLLNSIYGDVSVCDYGVSSHFDFDGEFDITISDLKRTKTYTKEIPGVSCDNVSISKRWVNRTKSLYIDVMIHRGDDVETCGFQVNTNIYNKFEYSVKDGVLTITLHEIVNEEPTFDLI